MATLRGRTLLLSTGVAIALVAGSGAAFAGIVNAGVVDSGGAIHACFKTAATAGGHGVVLQNVGTACPKGDTAIKWNQKGPKGATGATGPKGATGATGAPGPQGPSGVEFFDQYAPDSAANNGGGWAFLDTAPVFFMADTNTAANVTGTVDQASTDGNGVLNFIGICYQASGGAVTPVGDVEPEFTSPAGSWFAQTVSGVVGNLAEGDYSIGLCDSDQSSNLENGLAQVTIELSETADGVAGPAAGTAHSLLHRTNAR